MVHGIPPATDCLAGVKFFVFDEKMFAYIVQLVRVPESHKGSAYHHKLSGNLAM